MELFLARLFDGLAAGGGYAALALALVLIYKSTGLINFAQGEMALLGAYIAYVLAVEQGLPVVVGVALAMLIMGVVAAGIERVFIRPFPPDNHLPLVIVTLGLFLVINAGITVFWGTDPRTFPSMFPEGDIFTVGIASLTWSAVGTLATVVAAYLLVELLLRGTKVGLAFRAVSSNVESSELVGIRVGRTLQFGWALAAAVGTLAAVLIVPRLVQFEPTVMLRTLVFGFAAAALGGLDSLKGAVIGGIAVGLIQEMVVGYVGFIPSEMRLATAVAVIAIVLLFRPAGLFGTTKVVRV